MTALSPRQKPSIAFSNIKFESDPDDEFSVELKYYARDNSSASLIVESMNSKAIWSSRVDALESVSGGSISPIVNCVVVEVLQAWLSRSANGHAKVDLKRSRCGTLYLLIAMRDSVSGLVNGYWWKLHPVTVSHEKSLTAMMLHLCKHLELITDNDEPVELSLTAERFNFGCCIVWKICQSSKHFALADGGTTIQVAKPNKYQMTLIPEKVVCTLKYDVYVNSTCMHEFEISKNLNIVEKITTLDIPANSKLRLYSTSVNIAAGLTLLLKKIQPELLKRFKPQR
ncbi:unnamed protein product [Aphanomyces euteiches]|uniref:Uncharacterized protein n=1 Tax=Aphanomyces euteiches TaxID=100861 RepID=A0A6G0W8A7_9STRA|nr:hypothetical protein Ae201684_017917 [Aphanomyces euteiches]KAH9086917.1 hypothetical protein Ae201684P_000332 [Aphanomyces euteiches]KAH9140674.1 hypothetical protein AeRB84_015111 [Aphanomyces euteiches]